MSKQVPSWSFATSEQLQSKRMIDFPNRHEGYYFLEEATGWPFPSMYARMLVNVGVYPAPSPMIGGLDWGILVFKQDRLLQHQIQQTPVEWWDVNVAPTCPIWPGFAINTLFYAAILWLLFAAPGFARRRIRIRRGLCPACAYPVGDSPVCTECGKPLKKQKAEMT